MDNTSAEERTRAVADHPVPTSPVHQSRAVGARMLNPSVSSMRAAQLLRICALPRAASGGEQILS